MAPRNRQKRESGNVFVIVLLGVVLFAALMFTFSRSARQGGENLSAKQLDVSISDILSYAQSIERATNRVMTGGHYSESQIDFDNSIVAGYANLTCGADSKCKVFNPTGGGATWQNPPEGFNDGSGWIISGENAVPGIGADIAADLVLLLPGLIAVTCAAINEKLGISATLPQDIDNIDTTPFTGTFANTARIGVDADLRNVRAACIQNMPPAPDEYVFYYVLMDR